jgi:hypothetical protein
MEIDKALDIVHRMAESLYDQHGEFVSPAACPADAEEALEAVDEFICTYYTRDED